MTAAVRVTTPNSHEMTIAQVKYAKKVFDEALASKLNDNLSELARRIGVSPQAVQAWTVPGGVIPHKRVGAVCDAFEGEVEKHQLRPDVFTPPQAAAKKRK